MNGITRRACVSAIFTMIFTGACASLPQDLAHGIVNRWAPPSAAAGRALLDEYGLPDDATPNRLTWYGRGVWKRTVVWNRAEVYRSPVELAVMEQTVQYPLSYAQAEELLSFSGALEVDLERGELSSRAGREETDYLTLNLADEIVRGRRTVPQARAEYARLSALDAAGKSSPYTTGLLFPTGS